MCRTGGRRCPSHSDPLKTAAHNARRREKYAASKKTQQETAPVEYSYDFPPLKAFKELTPEAEAEYEAAGLALADRLSGGKPEEDYVINWKNIIENKLTPKAALLYYTAQGDKPIRDFLNNRRMKRSGAAESELKMSEEEKAWFGQTTAAIDEAFKSVEKPAEPRMLFRGIKVDHKLNNKQARQFVEENFPVGGIVSQKSYMSATVNPGTAADSFGAGVNSVFEENADHSIVMEIMSREGAPLNEGTSNYGTEEKEVLLPRALRLKVVSVDYNVSYKYSSMHDTNTAKNVSSKKTVIRLIDVGEEE